MKRCDWCGNEHTRRSVTCSDSCARSFRRTRGERKPAETHANFPAHRIQLTIDKHNPKTVMDARKAYHDDWGRVPWARVPVGNLQSRFIAALRAAGWSDDLETGCIERRQERPSEPRRTTMEQLREEHARLRAQLEELSRLKQEIETMKKELGE